MDSERSRRPEPATALARHGRPAGRTFCDTMATIIHGASFDQSIACQWTHDSAARPAGHMQTRRRFKHGQKARDDRQHQDTHRHEQNDATDNGVAPARRFQVRDGGLLRRQHPHKQAADDGRAVRDQVRVRDLVANVERIVLDVRGRHVKVGAIDVGQHRPENAREVAHGREEAVHDAFVAVFGQLDNHKHVDGPIDAGRELFRQWYAQVEPLIAHNVVDGEELNHSVDGRADDGRGDDHGAPVPLGPVPARRGQHGGQNHVAQHPDHRVVDRLDFGPVVFHIWRRRRRHVGPEQRRKEAVEHHLPHGALLDKLPELAQVRAKRQGRSLGIADTPVRDGNHRQVGQGQTCKHAIHPHVPRKPPAVRWRVEAKPHETR
ncbi:hypothetical protein H310_10827 [Aphanomyces invadans]|uniref:Uncharacterized protein n=1 Tax=Aphanomyces invadans TaxID=157072 RepID=A0A024TQ60_9STRA|nr:hypothetical protein H310_10827 [Aphanomyces invadans]ETV95761.1 hypothetical protein H310_10827 [Aphanomyces invadans]|eukprot:XP_008875512.1 hypothetical protein H310_10827 [Aphanomyces invadans]